MLQRWPSSTAILGTRLAASCQYPSTDTGATSAQRRTGGAQPIRRGAAQWPWGQRARPAPPRPGRKRREVSARVLRFEFILSLVSAAGGQGLVVRPEGWRRKTCIKEKHGQRSHGQGTERRGAPTPGAPRRPPGRRRRGHPALRWGGGDDDTHTPSAVTHPGPGWGVSQSYLGAGRLCSRRRGRAPARREGWRWPVGSSSSWPASFLSPRTSPTVPGGRRGGVEGAVRQRRVTPAPVRTRGTASTRYTRPPDPRHCACARRNSRTPTHAHQEDYISQNPPRRGWGGGSGWRGAEERAGGGWRQQWQQ